MDRAFDVPARPEMEAALVEFATRGDVRVRYGCEWLSTRRDDAGFVLGTSDGEYRCRVCVFAIGVTEPWVAPIPGLEAAPHYVAANAPERYEGKSVFIVGKRNSGFELAQGLLPWARRVVLGSPRPVDTAMLAFSPLSIRYLSPYTEHVRGGTGSYVVDAAIERVERNADGYRVHASGTTWEGELETMEAAQTAARIYRRSGVRIKLDGDSARIFEAVVRPTEDGQGDLEAERARVQKEIDRAEKMLANEKFVANADPGAVEGERAKLAQYVAERDALG
jgi:hypothetical protein